MDAVRRGVVGDYEPFTSPFGERRVVYSDWSASGRSLRFVEDYIRDTILPWYGNTHTSASHVGHQTSWYRHEARVIVQTVTNASSERDAVIFTGV